MSEVDFNIVTERGVNDRTIVSYKDSKWLK